jgi:hypothetical protein
MSATNVEEGNMRKAILGAVSALALGSPAMAADLPLNPYSEGGPAYEREAYSYEYRTVPPVVVEEPAPVVSETVVVRRPVVVAPAPMVVEEYPVYRPRVYASPRAYAYAPPRYWGYRHHFRGGW